MSIFAQMHGVSTRLQVKKLKDTYPEAQIKPGPLAPLTELAKIIEEDVSSRRFDTVVRAWRKEIERESFIEFSLVDGVLIVLDDTGKLGKSKAKSRTASKCLKKALYITGKIDRINLTDEACRELEFQQKRTAQQLAIANIKKLDHLPSLDNKAR